MRSVRQTIASSKLNERLATNGFRHTAQREHVYEVLVKECDHPTAEEVFIRAKRRMPEISMVTVYNCLDTLVKAHLIRQVNLDRAATRYCPNMQDHSHFYCDVCGHIFDIPLGRSVTPSLPRGFQMNHSEISLRGTCSECAEAPEARTK